MMPSLRDSPAGPLENPLEMRAQPRVGANFPIRVHSRDFAIPLEGSARDLSVNGACVATTAPFAVKSIQQIELILPQQTLVLEAEILSIRANAELTRDLAPIFGNGLAPSPA